MIKHSYKKAERLKSRKLIEKIFVDGKNLFKYPIKLVYLEIPQDTFPVYFTSSVSKRIFKKAVDRNRIKRLIREGYRLNKHKLWQPLENKDYSLAIMAIYVGKEELPYHKIEQTILNLMQQLNYKMQN
jgi:ribonuclease P protein component